MSKQECKLNHSRNLSTRGRVDDYYYDIERSKATAKQIKFYKSLWYKFKDNNIDINTELDKRGIEHSVIQRPHGRCGYSNAIDTMIDILTDCGVMEKRDDSKRNKFVRVYTSTYDSGGGMVRAWEKLEPREGVKNET